MNTRRSSVVRFAASALLTIAFCVGTQAFVPAAFGCGAMGTGNCRTDAGTGAMGTGNCGSTADALVRFLDQVRVMIDSFDVVLP
jgi:hypothetical protein